MYIRRLGEFEEWGDQCITDSPVALDTETTGLNYYYLEIEGFSLANDEGSCYVNLVNNPQKTALLAALKEIVESRLVIMHNAPFDMSVLHKYLINPLEVYDTMTAAHLLDENGPKGLKDLAHIKLRIPKQCIKSYDEIQPNTPEFYKYAENDAKWTWALYNRQKPELDKQGLAKLFYEIEMPFQYVLRDMNVLGMGYDKGKRDDIYFKLRHAIFSIEHDLLDMCDGRYNIRKRRTGELECNPSINFGSSKQLVSIAEHRYGLEITERTKKGAKSFSKETKQRLKSHPFVALVDKFHKARKLMNTFVEPFNDYVDPDDRIRASFNNAVAVTGRLSCSNPNLEQLAKNSELCNVRDMFVPKEGYVLVVADYSGQELTVLAEVTKDEVLLDTILNDKDIHLMVANSVFHLGLPDGAFIKGSEANAKAKEDFEKERHGAKNGIVFPIVYGSTAHGIASYFAISVAEAQGYVDSFMELYPGIKESIDRTTLLLKRQEYVTDMFGRRRRFPGYRNLWHGHQRRCERQAFNFLIQSPSATMCRQAANRIHAAGYDIVNLVHDEIVAEVPEDGVEERMQRITELMTTDTGLSIPIGVEIDYGYSYGEAK